VTWILALFKVCIRTNPWLAALFVFVFDVPRDLLSFLSIAIERGLQRLWYRPPPATADIAVVIPALNPGAAILKTLEDVRRQTIKPRQVIVIDDGSTDESAAILAAAEARGLVDIAIFNDQRMGVSAACNKALHFVRTEFVLFLDSDTELEPDACAHLVDKLKKPDAGAVSGNIGIRNARASLWTAIQQIEYMIAIDFGRAFLDKFNAIACCSGAMTMFRTAALRGIGGYNVGSGQDLDVTLRLRRAGYRARFASRAWAFTEAPETFEGLLRQRLRWERDALRIHVFQHHQFRRSGRTESLGNTIQRYDFINFTFFPTVFLPLLPLALAQLPAGEVGGFLLGGYLLLVFMTFLNLAVVFSAHRRPVDPFVLLLLPIFPFYQGTLMKGVRLYAYLSETIWHASRHDRFVPARIRELIYKEEIC